MCAPVMPGPTEIVVTKPIQISIRCAFAGTFPLGNLLLFLICQRLKCLDHQSYGTTSMLACLPEIVCAADSNIPRQAGTMLQPTNGCLVARLQEVCEQLQQRSIFFCVACSWLSTRLCLARSDSGTPRHNLTFVLSSFSTWRRGGAQATYSLTSSATSPAISISTTAE